MHIPNGWTIKNFVWQKNQAWQQLVSNFENEINEEEGVEKEGQRRWGLMLL